MHTTDAKEDTMTLQAAYDLLTARWPGRSFCIGLELWNHEHSEPGGAHRTEEWSVYDQVTRQHFYGETLGAAMEAALGCDADGLDNQKGEWT